MKKRTKWWLISLAAVLAIAVIVILLTAGKTDTPDYAAAENWAYFGIGDGRDADLFLVCPTVYGGSAEAPNMPLDDEKAHKSFLGALNMERGIYDGDCRLYAPYYRQAGMTVYGDNAALADTALELAYQDVRAAFMHYVKHENKGRPIVLAGFSQGSEHCLRLIKDVFSDEALRGQLVSVYMIGWRVTQEDLDGCAWLKMAQGEDDYGSIVCFDCEAPALSGSLVIPAGMKSYTINPLNWRTDGTPAAREENLGACFTDYSAGIKEEIPALCGCYIDPVRGALKVTDITPEDYPPLLGLFGEGEYHIYDYQFFYRNLQQNVGLRLDAFLAEAATLDNAA